MIEKIYLVEVQVEKKKIRIEEYDTYKLATQAVARYKEAGLKAKVRKPKVSLVRHEITMRGYNAEIKRDSNGYPINTESAEYFGESAMALVPSGSTKVDKLTVIR